MARDEAYEDLIPVPRIALRLPVELPLPAGFDAARAETWPRVEGRLEFVYGRLLYMPPCAAPQQMTAADVLGLLWAWRRTHPDFVVGGNEAGILLGGDARGADAAVWRRSDLPVGETGFRRAAPVLAVEVAGKYDDEDLLREKATWYLGHGTAVVWLLFPATPRVVVLTAQQEQTFAPGDRLPDHPALPGLAPAVNELFEQASSI